MKKCLLFFAVLAGLYACSTVPITGRQQLSLVSNDEVLSLSLQQYDDYMKTAKKSTDKTATALVEKVGKNIAEAVALYFQVTEQSQLLAGFQWDFVLVDDPQVNAFCMPGGKIVIYTGILPYTKDETGLSVVVGHEVGHAIAKHANERISQQLLVQYGGAGLGAVLAKTPTAVQSIGSVVYGLGTEVGVMLPYSRKQELEADYIGIILMAIAGYDPGVAATFWERMSQQKNNSTVEFLSTHPSDNTRISEIKKRIPEAMEYYEAIYGKKPDTTTPANNTNNWRF